MKKLVVLGGGESGVGTAILGQKLGYQVFVSDFGTILDKYKKELDVHHIAWEEKQHSESVILAADLVMKSPGIPDKAPIVQKLIANQIQIVSEIEIASQHSKAQVIGITGSNGKTTTTLLTHFIMEQAGIDAGLAGNIGMSYAQQVAENDKAIYVLELSSFQLDGIVNFAPNIAVLANLSPDHLDRYHYNYDEYIAAKFRITENQTASDFFIYDADDVEIQRWFKTHQTQAKKLPFSLTQKFNEGAFLENNQMVVVINQKRFTMSTDNLSVKGKHNLKNAMAAATVAKILDIQDESLRSSLANFNGAEHRLEKVLKIQNVQYINDSKATNVNAVFFALDSMTTPTVWIVGGVDKGNDYLELMPLVREKVKAIVCLGVDNKKIIETFKDVIDTIVETDSMDECVKTAHALAEPGDTVLLSPACASFDLFESYEDRGRKFKNAVQNL
ncbi:UDP-N-acetylmuramoyl-L-alanine--D-glutamate ligase [Flavobacterium agricola]|uniref:UDP-N-acetylmuramoylalanine--D-glutamate ligase n=1 Tax=Flavobacterium agricola TaxID=2870839 RepID=A0ABY6LZ19_9FLAO|nr:UDP-N-acetylmuramoyl-L-alanine--D-glutamate ligase [Flavobacterium agricola]UYW00654.1 UDP-N-acetylmuramoyl-L-alanine--D-glutamate ligase [Flavobacterium agricola]